MLLDLLGTKDTKFYSFFPETERWHRHLAEIEKKLKATGLIPSSQPLHFLEKSTYVNYIEDDHIPFLRRGTSFLMNKLVYCVLMKYTFQGKEH